MEAKHLSAVIHGKVLDVVKGCTINRIIKNSVSTINCHLKAISHDLITVEGLKDDFDEPSVHWVSDSSSIVGFSCHIVQCLIGDQFILVKEHLQLRLRNGKIGCCELVGDVPTQRTILSSFQDDGMEER